MSIRHNEARDPGMARGIAHHCSRRAGPKLP